MKKVGIYARVSTDKQDVDKQVKELKSIALLQKYMVNINKCIK